MGDFEAKNVAKPDETRPFASKGQAAVVNVLGGWCLSSFGHFERLTAEAETCRYDVE